MTLGERIKRQRKIKKVSQEELAARIGMKHSVISKYENNQITPSVEQIHKIAATLEIPDYELFYDSYEDFIKRIEGAKFVKKSSPPLEEWQTIYGTDINTGEHRPAFSSKEEFEKWERTSTEQNRKKALSESFEKLNVEGQRVAVERIDELAEIPKYQKEKPQAAEDPSEAE